MFSQLTALRVENQHLRDQLAKAGECAVCKARARTTWGIGLQRSDTPRETTQPIWSTASGFRDSLNRESMAGSWGLSGGHGGGQTGGWRFDSDMS